MNKAIPVNAGVTDHRISRSQHRRGRNKWISDERASRLRSFAETSLIYGCMVLVWALFIWGLYTLPI